MFSQSTDNMGLTDIEMTQFDYDDPYYDERQYEVEYEVRSLYIINYRYVILNAFVSALNFSQKYLYLLQLSQQ